MYWQFFILWYNNSSKGFFALVFMDIYADINGALNILRKSNVVSLEGLYTRGVADTPIRIRIA